MPWELKKYYPLLGTHVALYVMPVGLLLGYMCSLMDAAFCRKARFVWLVGFALLVTVMFAQGSALGLAHLGCPSYGSPLRIATHDLLPIFALLTLIGFSRELCSVRYLVLAGRNSLYIYLLGQPAVVGVTVLYRGWFGLNGQADILLCGTLSVVSGMVFGLAVASVIELLPMARILLFPRSHKELSAVIIGHVRTLSRLLMAKYP